MRIIITGASGNVGSALVPRLAAHGFELLLVGRDVDVLQRRFPGFDACDDEQLADRAAGYDVLLNLAAVNSDSVAPESEFYAVNAELPRHLAALAAKQGIRRFVHISTVHALDASRDTPYARSKRLGGEKLVGIKGIEISVVYLPAVHGEHLTGRWRVLNRMPRCLRNVAINALSAFRPVVSVDTLFKKLLPCLIGDNPPSELVVSNGQATNPFYQTLCRLIDLATAFVIIVFFGWLLLIVWALIRINSEGPGIFAQQRIGKNGRIFVCYKFRTMHVGTKQSATHEVDFSSVTSLGKILRRTKLDELPQVWNLLKGEMTLVGPRPCLPSQTELIEGRHRSGVLEMTPGITGLAQVNGIDMSIPQRLVDYDQRYLGMQSLLLDLKILIMTVTGKGSGDPLRRSA